jgi:hypothetical protein
MPADATIAGDLTSRLVAWLDPPEDFNYRHFRMRHMAAELLHSIRADCVPPGRMAPDFELESTSGTLVRLRDLRGRPVLLHFVSYTCPVTRGGVVLMKELHHLYGSQVQFIEMLVRQAHPGERHGAYHSYQQKLDEARLYQQEEAVDWPVVIDDLEGTVQRAYGGLAAAVYLIDSAGRVAFCGIWGQAPPLRQAIDDLLAHGGTGVAAAGGIDRAPHLATAIVAGRSGPARGGVRALIDLELGFPGAFVLMTLGRLGRPILAPLVFRTAPLPAPLRVGMMAGAVALATVLCRIMRRTRA